MLHCDCHVKVLFFFFLSPLPYLTCRDLNKEIRERKIQMKRRAERDGSGNNSPNSTAKISSLKAAIGDMALMKRDEDGENTLSPLHSPRQRVNHVAERDRSAESKDRLDILNKERSTTLEALLSPRADRDLSPNLASFGNRGDGSGSASALVSPRRRPTGERVKRNMQQDTLPKTEGVCSFSSFFLLLLLLFVCLFGWLFIFFICIFFPAYVVSHLVAS
jgi:hypothetical protein